MSFPPRPPPGMMHGMPQHPQMFGIVPPPPMPPMGHPGMRPRIPYMGRPRGPPPNIPRDPSGSPPVTVFVGNISERAQDAMIRTLLASCGPLVSWKRVQVTRHIYMARSNGYKVQDAINLGMLSFLVCLWFKPLSRHRLFWTVHLFQTCMYLRFHRYQSSLNSNSFPIYFLLLRT